MKENTQENQLHKIEKFLVKHNAKKQAVILTPLQLSILHDAITTIYQHKYGWSKTNEISIYSKEAVEDLNALLRLCFDKALDDIWRR